MPERKAWQHSEPNRHKRGLGRAHQKARAELLAHEPLCRLCKTKGKITSASIADHIVPRAKGGSGDISNLQPVCPTCHDDKTRADLGWKQRRKTIALDGWPVDD